jgi:predicted PurR-regulated permease PerM
MIFIVILLIIIIVALSTILAVSVIRNIDMLNKLEEMGIQIEESLDILDEYHQKIDIASKTDVMFDDPVVKNLLNDISGCRDAVLIIANKLYGSLDVKEDNK